MEQAQLQVASNRLQSTSGGANKELHCSCRGRIHFNDALQVTWEVYTLSNTASILIRDVGSGGCLHLGFGRVKEYYPGHPEDGCFQEGAPPRGFRNLVQSIEPYHANPEWMIWPDVGSFERDQKVASLYTLATGLFTTLNRCIREDNEDGMRRHA
eukprot:6451834-Amphidinium_carterae.1